ncbi:AarF/ABC1/UbiB kinase family protein [uncultured Ilyobacter sp.]|uniref:AarF/ABC1/UbiB kinase family protein n=1 Tax=uncultured Ilyobacter sp. TaxID=544433 RepID=UPI0029C780B9|nr:AarF/ABC1/UbiB kinase family protein [uncultured Ilyobacter sp.]
MNGISFLRLIKSFYSSELPSLEKIEKKGLLAVKIAQHYALRVDFIREEMCYHLSKLYTHSFPAEKKNLSQLLSGNSEILNHFKSWDETPFSSASVGQVHKAVLNNGEVVAVKIIKKEFKKGFIEDIERIEKPIKKIGYLWPKFNRIFNPIGIIENIRNYTLDELDLKNEAKGIEVLRSYKDNFSKEFDLSNLKFPKVYPKLSSEKILVTEFIDGETFDSLLNNKRLPYKTLLELFRLHSFYIFKLGVFHGDIHPGNVILGKDGNIYLVDCASLSEITPKLKKGLFWFFYYLSRYDYKNAAKYLHEMSTDRLERPAFDEFEKKFIELYKDFTLATVSEVSLTKRMMETIKMGINFGMNFGDQMFPVIKSLMYLDGMVMRCNPKAVLMEDMRNFTVKLEEHMK